MTYSYEATASGLNPDNVNEEKSFYINRDGKTEATKLFFSSFVDTYFRYIEEQDSEKKQTIIQPIRMAIVHESLHIFNYNELEARSCSEDLIKTIETYKPEIDPAN